MDRGGQARVDDPRRLGCASFARAHSRSRRLVASVLSLATLFGLAAALVAGSATSAERDSGSTFLTKALGRPLVASPATRVVGSLETRVDRRSYAVASKSASVSLASEGVGDREWRAFANGFSRDAPFGRETIITE